MEIIYDEKFKYKIYTGKLHGDNLKYPKQIGYAKKCSEHEHYFVRLWMFPEQTFYLVKGEPYGDEHRYRLFSSCKEFDGETQYYDQIGSAFLSKKSKEFMEIKLNFPNQRIFMSLYPKVIRSHYEFYTKVKSFKNASYEEEKSIA